MSASLHVLCAGAVQGLVKALAPRFLAGHGATIEARFGAVGAMREALLGGAPCDVMIVTEAMLEGLRGEGALGAGPIAPIGRVATGVAGRAGEPLPRVDSAPALAAALAAAPALYLPDIELSTAGRHVAGVLARLGIADALRGRLQVFPNGATAMRALAEHGPPGALGSTQVTEILYTPGLVLAGALPAPFALSTVYAAAVAGTSREPALAAAFIALLVGEEASGERRAGGFAPLAR